MTKTIFLSLIALLILGACGVKPGHVDPLGGKNADSFPRTYPAE